MCPGVGPESDAAVWCCTAGPARCSEFIEFIPRPHQIPRRFGGRTRRRDALHRVWAARPLPGYGLSFQPAKKKAIWAFPKSPIVSLPSCMTYSEYARFGAQGGRLGSRGLEAGLGLWRMPIA